MRDELTTWRNAVAASTELRRFDPDTFARIWNEADDAVSAARALCTLYKAPPELVHQCAELLLAAGLVRPLPIKQDGSELTEAAVFEFCLLWERSTTFQQVHHALRLPKSVVLDRYRALTALGIVLNRKPDMVAEEDGVRAAVRGAWTGDVGRINAALDGELLIRTALLKQKKIKDKLAAALILLGQAKLRLEVEKAVDNNLRGALSLVEDVFRDMGVTG